MHTIVSFLFEIRLRQEVLYWFGWSNFACAFLFLVLWYSTGLQILGINAWIKPIKFALSIGIYAWTMAWYLAYLGPKPWISGFSWAVAGLLGWELLYIAFQAGRGQLSHFNSDAPLYAFLYFLMGLAASLVAVGTGFVGYKFCTQSFPDLPVSYLWSIRLGIFLFVIFSFEGFVMGSRLSHTIGGPDGGPGIPFLNWSTRYGDPRVSHFIGMHALQVLPILAWFFIRSTSGVFLLAGFYGLLAAWTLIQAIQGRPFWGK